MSFLVPLIALAGAVFCGWVAVSHLVRMKFRRRGWALDWPALTLPLYGGLCVTCLAVAGLIGMLPAIPWSRIRFVGNAASFGAKRALLSRVEKDYADRVFLSVEHVDLSISPDFQMEFAAAMMLPEADEAGDCGAE